MCAALAGLLLSVFLSASPAAHAATECGDPTEQTDGTWLILCNSSSYDPDTEGDIVYTLSGTDVVNERTQYLTLDDVDVTTLSGDGRAAVHYEIPEDGKNMNNIVRMINGATVSTTGDGHEAIFVNNMDRRTLLHFSEADAKFIIEDNSSVTTTGNTAAHAVWIERNQEGTLINLGVVDATVQDSATISTTGNGSHALYAYGVKNQGHVRVDVKDSATVSTTGNNSHAIYARKWRTQSSVYPINSDMIVNVTGGSVTASGSGSKAIYAERRSTDESNPRAVKIRILVSDATVTSAQNDAITIVNAEGSTARTLTLRHATVQRTDSTGANGHNAVWFSSNHANQDTVTIAGPGTTNIKGHVDTGSGTDSLVLNACTDADRENASAGDDCHDSIASGSYTLTHTDGEFKNLEDVVKFGSGTVGIHDLNVGNAAINLKDGALLIEGHLDLGTGVLTIQDTSRLVFASTGTEFGRITAAKVKFDDDVDEKIYLAAGSSLAANSDLLLTGKFHDHDDDETSVSLHSATDPSGTALSTVSSEGVVQTASTGAPDGNECGVAPTSGDPRTITCSDSTYVFQTTGPTGNVDPGIEYQFANTDSNNYAINVSGSIDVDTTANQDIGLDAAHLGSGNLTIDMQSGDIETKGFYSGGIRGNRIGTGDLSINMSGGSIKIGTGNDANTGLGSFGIRGNTGPTTTGDLSISMTGGSIETGFGTGTSSGTNAYGIYAYHEGNGSSTISLENGSIHTKGSRAYGIRSYNHGYEDANGDASTSMITMSGGTIDTEGDTAYGIDGLALRGGNIGIDLTSAISAGTCTSTDSSGCDIHTRGNFAHGIHGHAAIVSNIAPTGNVDIDMAGGDILTEGNSARGIYGRQSGSGDIDITLSGGGIKTGTGNGENTGFGASGIRGDTSDTASGALSINMTGGSIETGFGTGTNAGNLADGIHAEHEGTGSSAITLGNGSIHTKGWDADGIFSYNSGTEDANGNASTSMVTMSGGTIDTEGADAVGITGSARRGGNIDIDLTSAISAGTCTGSGPDDDSSGCDIHTRSSSAHGIHGYAKSTTSGGTTTQPTGDIEITMASGDILTEGSNAYGIYGDNPGSGALNITLSGGDILTEGSGARGIYAKHGGTGSTVTLSGGDILTKGSGAHGIYVQTGDNGAPSVSVTNSSVETTIAGAQAIIFNSSNANRTVTLRGATLIAPSGGTAMSLPGNGNDTVTILGHKDVGGMATTTIESLVNFSADSDKLVFSTCRSGDTDSDCSGQTTSGGDLTLDFNSVFQNLETISKIGSGLARLHDLNASHSNTNMSIDKGSLLLDGHLNLGTGVLTIHDSNRLIFASTSTEFGRITASKVKFDDDVTEKVYLGYGSSLAANSDLLLNPDSSTTAKFEDSAGNDVSPGLHSIADPDWQRAGHRLRRRRRRRRRVGGRRRQ